MVAVGVGIVGMLSNEGTLQCCLTLVPCANGNTCFIEAPLSVGSHWTTYDHHPTHKSKLNQLSVTSTVMSPWSLLSLPRSYLDKNIGLIM